MKYAKLIFKNMLRNKRRTLLTISSLVVSLFLIISLATILTEFERGSEEASPLRLVSRHAVSLGFVIPMAHLEKMKTVPGVKEVMPFSWFGGIYIDERNFFANFAVDARKLKEVIPADEPTGNLDARSGEEILQILSTLNRELKKTIMLVTHDPHAASFASEQKHLEKGILTEVVELASKQMSF